MENENSLLTREIEALIQGSASAEQVRSLEQRLRNDKQARGHYLSYVNLHATLGTHFRSGSATGKAQPKRIVGLITIGFFLVPSLVIWLITHWFSDYSLALAGWADSASTLAFHSSVFISPFVGLLWLVSKRIGWVRRPRLDAIGGGVSILFGMLSTLAWVGNYKDAELIRREEMIQQHRWVSYDSVFFFPGDLEQITKRPAQKPTVEQIRQELTTLRELGFTGVVVQGSYNVEVAPIARDVGFTAVVQTIHVSDPKRLDDDETQGEILKAIAVKDHVDAYVFGELRANEVKLEALKAELARIRWKTGKPVTTSFLQQDYAGKRGERLLELEDFVVPALPRLWKGDSADPKTAIAAVGAAFESLRAYDKPALLTYVFYPSGGGDGFSEANQREFFEGVLELSIDRPRGTNFVAFSSFDRPWAKLLSEATEYTPAFEAHTGLLRPEFSDNGNAVQFEKKEAAKLFKNNDTNNKSQP